MSVTAAHIHTGMAGENGPPIITLFDGSGTLDEDNPASGATPVNDDVIFALLRGGLYVNVHTAENAGGEIRGQIGPFAAPARLMAFLSGDQEVPAVSTDASGVGRFSYDPLGDTLYYRVEVDNIADIVGAHIHQGWPGENGGVVFPLFTGAGAFGPENPIGGSIELDAPQLVDLFSGYYYVNVHTTEQPAGEIRGQIIVPLMRYLPVAFKS
jgi:hypothetical protein